MGRQRKQKQLRKTVEPAGRPGRAPATAGARNTLRLSAAVISVFAVLFILTAVTAYSRKSSTMDEPIHLLAGYSYLKWGDFRMNPEHPPLAKMWAALPLLAFGSQAVPKDFDAPAPRYFSGTIVARDLQSYFPGIPIDRVFFYAKLQMVLLGVALGIAVFAWAKELFGFQAAAAALFLYAIDPNVLAHSQLVHTDLPFAAVSFTAVYFLWRTVRRATWGNVLCFCLFFALTAATKDSFMALLPIMAVLGAVEIFSPPPLPVTAGNNPARSGRRDRALKLLGVFVAAALAAYIGIWAVYGFRFNAGPHGAPIALTAMPASRALQNLLSVLVEFQIFPHAWIDGQVFNLTHLTRTAYLLGEISDTGFWAYFPVGFAVKTPVPILALLAVGIYFIARRRIDRAAAVFLLLPPAIFFLLAVLSRMNIGYRHVLQIYPFLFVIAGAAAAKLWKSGLPAKAAAALLGLWLVVSAVFIYPNHLAYFNELAGGPKSGYKVLVDSNLDWGQDLKGLGQFIEEKNLGKIYLSYFGTADPCFYHIHFTYITALPPRPSACAETKQDGKAPDFLAVSASNRILTRSYDWLKNYQPIAQIGYSIFVYDIRGNREAHKNLGIVYLKSGLLDDARREFTAIGEPLSDKQLASIDLGDTAAPYVNLGAVFFDKGMLAEAIVEFQRALKLKPDDADTRSNLGGTYLSLNKTDDAIKEFEAALKIDPANAEAHNNLGTANLRKGRPDIAYAHYKEAVRLKPDYTDAQENLKIAEQAQQTKQR